MNPTPLTPSSGEVLADIDERMEAGLPVDWDAEVAAHPSLAEEIENLRWAGKMFPRLRQPAAGDRVGGYELTRYLGGGVGEVFAARDPAGREVALKLVGPGEEPRVHRLSDFIGMRHERIVPVEAVGTHAGLPFVVMELVEGGDLREWIADYSAHPDHCEPAELPARLRAIAQLVADVADGVAFLHLHAIIHRDLKPENILIGGGGPRVCDFGLARRIDESLRVSVLGQLVGTWAYMAPEQLASRAALSVRADVWSLGAILYELLTGHPPYCPPGVQLPDLLREKEQQSLPPRPSEVNANLPRDSDLEWVCLQCLHRDPARRPKASELAEMLRSLMRRGKVRPDETWRLWARRVLRGVFPWPSADQPPPPSERKFLERCKHSLRIEAGTTFVAHVGVFLLAASAAPGWLLWAWFLAADKALGWLAWAPVNGRETLTPTERTVAHWWVGADIASVALFWLFCPVLGPADPHAVNQFYAAYAVVRGLTFWIEGCALWGRLHYIGVSFLLAGVAIPFAEPVGPLVYAVLYSGWFIWFSCQSWDDEPGRV